MNLSYCAGLLFLAVLASEDIRRKEISVYKVIFSAGLSILYRIFSGQFLWQEIMWGLIPGILLILLAFCTRENIGYGDGAAIMVLGLWTGGWFTLAVLWVGIMMAGVFGVFCLIRKKKEPIPFIPFLLLGMEAALYYA